MGMRDGSFSHFFVSKVGRKWEPSLIPIFLIYVSKKWEKEPSLIPIFPIYVQQKAGKGTVPHSQFPPCFTFTPDTPTSY